MLLLDLARVPGVIIRPDDFLDAGVQQSITVLVARLFRGNISIFRFSVHAKPGAVVNGEAGSYTLQHRKRSKDGNNGCETHIGGR
jgi:hypothetical protein